MLATVRARFRPQVAVVGRVAIVALLVNVGAGACGPAGCCSSAEVSEFEQATRTGMQHEVERFEFHRPIGEVWPELVGVLSERGYTLAEKSPVEGRTLETADKPGPNGRGAERVLVRVIRVSADRYRITVDLQHKEPLEDGGAVVTLEEDHGVGTAAHQIKWTLMQRAEPQRATEIEDKVKKKADRAAAVGRGCDKGCATCGAVIGAGSK